MDERLEKALQTANFLASLNLVRKNTLEEYKQELIFYHNGCSFIADLQFISQIYCIKQNQPSAVILDINSIPCTVNDLEKFYQTCFDTYNRASQDYNKKYQSLKKKRNVKNLVDL